MNPEQSPTDVYNEMTAMLQRMRQELEEIEAIKTKLAATDTRLLLTQTELKITQQQLQATEEYIDNTLVGSVTAFATINPPDGWLECNGQTASREQYARLFAKIGTIYGEGDGSTTFNLPDLCGKFVRGYDGSGKFDADRTFGSYQADQIQSHRHDGSSHSHSGTTSVSGSHNHQLEVKTFNYEVKKITGCETYQLSDTPFLFSDFNRLNLIIRGLFPYYNPSEICSFLTSENTQWTLLEKEENGQKTNSSFRGYRSYLTYSGQTYKDIKNKHHSLFEAETSTTIASSIRQPQQASNHTTYIDYFYQSEDKDKASVSWSSNFADLEKNINKIISKSILGSLGSQEIKDRFKMRCVYSFDKHIYNFERQIPLIDLVATSDGSHSHSFSTNSSDVSVGLPTETNHGSETCPKNVALLYCIKY